MSLILGSISYRTGVKRTDLIRASAHQEQLRWLESLSLGDYRFLRIEQNYDNFWKEKLSTSLSGYEGVSFSKGIGPSKARNILLEELYSSEANWLVCMDDDRTLYSHYNGSAFIEELDCHPLILKLGSQGVMITGIVPQIRAFKKDNSEFGKVSTYWFLRKSCLDGCLQIVCIPNLKKFGLKPVWFDESNNLEADKPSEDVQFAMDWILGKNQIACNNMMIIRDWVPLSKRASACYESYESRLSIQKTQGPAIDRYVREKTRGRIQNHHEFNRKRNAFKPIAIPRLTPYSPVDSDFGQFKSLSSICDLR